MSGAGQSVTLTHHAVCMGYLDEGDAILGILQMLKLPQIILYRGSDDRMGIERSTLGW